MARKGSKPRVGKLDTLNPDLTAVPSTPPPLPPVVLNPGDIGVDIGRSFVLYRHKDASGVSGVGLVAWGFQFPDGKVAVRWCSGEVRQTAVWDSIEDVEKIHGHGGMTSLLWGRSERFTDGNA